MQLSLRFSLRKIGACGAAGTGTWSDHQYQCRMCNPIAVGLTELALVLVLVLDALGDLPHQIRVATNLVTVRTGSGNTS
ncbi:hypothetical protein DFS33DRAFT_1457349 [Desarmillaria ectypa]|nr:hypothetical protein DFS33DRAFT_1457349 [Desarmillaria ectypa]